MAGRSRSGNTPPPSEHQERIVDIDVSEEMRGSFLEYAYSVIYSRALPDARDGLKPVHRRILFQMADMGLRPDRAHVKCARVVGDVMGKLHPHGDSAIYDALVRMAQPWAMRLPLVDGHGNFGSLDDGPAAYRYCLTGDTRIRLWDGSSPRIDQLVGLDAPGERELDVTVIDKDGKPVTATMGFHSGSHPTRTLLTASGHTLRGSRNHPVLCLVPYLGVPMLQWLRLEEIGPGTVVCLARHAARQVVPTPREHELGTLLGAWVSEGFADQTRAVFNNTDRDFFDEVLSAYDRVVGGPRYVYERRTRRLGTRIWELDVQRLDALRESPLAELIGLRARDKRVPEAVWQSSTAVKRAFLMALFAGDGGVRRASDDSITVQYSTYSPTLARQVQELLLEFGVFATHKVCRSREEHRLIISGQENIRAFAEYVGFTATKQGQLQVHLRTMPRHTHRLTADMAPYVADYLRASCPPGRGSGKSWLLRNNFDRMDHWRMNRHLLLERFKDQEVLRTVLPIMDSGYRFDRVVSCTDGEPEPVFSVRVASEDHSFLAGGFINHNTECRMAPPAMEMVASLDEDVADLRPSYDGDHFEPEVLPAAFPNLLVNGASGIAVGMATNMAPHNLVEVIAAARHLIAHPDAGLDELMRFVPGPDLPTGGSIVGLDGIREAYETGRGSFRTRAQARVESVTARRKGIVVTELPYGVGPEKVIEKIKDLVGSKRLAGIADVIDLTDREHGLRLVIEVKNGFHPEALLEQLYRLTPMEDSFSINNVALVDGQPRTLGLRNLLQVYVEHRIDVVRRRTRFRRNKAGDELHLVEGLHIAVLNIDEVIQVIRSSEDTAEARARLMGVFDLTETQASYILEMPLRRLTRLSVLEIERRRDELIRQIEELAALLDNDRLLRTLVSDELADVAKRFGTPRRTVLLESAGTPAASSMQLEVTDDPCWVLMSSTGLLARTGGEQPPARGTTRARHDVLVSAAPATARGEVAVVTSLGRMVRLPVLELPALPPTAAGPNLSGGVPLTALLTLQPDEQVLGLATLAEGSPGLAVGTAQGVVKRVAADYPGNRDAWEVIALREGDRLVGAVQLRTGREELVFITSDAQLLRFGADLVRPQGRAASGIAGIRVGAGEHVVHFGAHHPGENSLVVTIAGSRAALPGTEAGTVKITPLSEYPGKGRGTSGVRCHRFLRGEDTLLLAWAGPGPAQAAAASGVPVDLPTNLGRRDGSGTPAAQPIAGVGGPVLD